MHGDASVKGFLVGRISGRQQRVESTYGRGALSADGVLESGSYKIPSSSQLADCESLGLLEHRYSTWLLFSGIPSSFTNRLL
jgi:hypothetical protein